MAFYKQIGRLTYDESMAFDVKCTPGTAALNAGVYRCCACGDEIGIAKGHSLPAQNHHQHAQGLGKIEWQLIVCASSKS